MTPYLDIYAMFIKSVNSEKLLHPELDDIEVIEDLFQDYLFESADLMFTKCRQDLSERDEIGFNSDLTQLEKRILVRGMMIKWLVSSHIANDNTLEDFFTTKDYNIFSPASKISALNKTYELWMKEFIMHVRNYQYAKVIKDNV